MFREREGESKPQIEEEMWTALVGSIAHARTMNRQQIRAILSKTHSSLYFDHAHERLMFPSSTQSAIPKRKRPVIPSEGFLWKQIRNRRASRASRREPSVAHRGRILLIVRTFQKFNHYVRIRCVCVYVRDVKDNCGCSVRFFNEETRPQQGPLFSVRSFTTTPPPLRNNINKKYKKKRRNVLPVEQYFAADGSIHANTFVNIIIRAR